MQSKIISMKNEEKEVNYDKLNSELEEIKNKMEYWKNEHFALSISSNKKIKELKAENKRLVVENNSLKEIISKVNRGNNEK